MLGHDDAGQRGCKRLTADTAYEDFVSLDLLLDIFLIFFFLFI